MIRSTLNRLVKKEFIQIELGFLLIDLVSETLIDIVHTISQTNYKWIFWPENLVFILTLLFCLSSIAAIIISACFVDRHFLIMSAIDQVFYIITCGLKSVGYLLGFMPKYWTLQWITLFQLTSCLVIPLVTLVLLSCQIFFGSNQTERNESFNMEKPQMPNKNKHLWQMGIFEKN